MAKLIKMPFGMWTQVGPRNHVLDWGPEGGNFKGKKGPAKDMPGHVQQSIYSE